MSDKPTDIELAVAEALDSEAWSNVGIVKPSEARKNASILMARRIITAHKAALEAADFMIAPMEIGCFTRCVGKAAFQDHTLTPAAMETAHISDHVFGAVYTAMIKDAAK